MQKILLIEDEENLCENIKSALQINNFEVYTASNGKDGYDNAVELNPDLILCDIMMPVYDGYWMLNKIRSNEFLASTPFIFITAKVDREDLRKGMELGADDYLTKPFKINELIRAVNARLLRHSSAKINVNGIKKKSKLDIDKFILLDTGKNLERIHIASIVCIIADNVFSKIYLSEKKTISIRKSLNTWEELLPDSFIRVHRSAIINLSQVKHFEKWFNQTIRVHMHNYEEPISISRNYTSLLKEKLIL